MAQRIRQLWEIKLRSAILAVGVDQNSQKAGQPARSAEQLRQDAYIILRENINNLGDQPLARGSVYSQKS